MSNTGRWSTLVSLGRREYIFVCVDLFVSMSESVLYNRNHLQSCPCRSLCFIMEIVYKTLEINIDPTL